ncbi:MAG TPA: helix-turn-helix domain-containing protein [Streptosporangiaceae bacterium]|nr:helix-turn-helix domain-containing protein [Streptosporangiaceae bacterium]
MAESPEDHAGRGPEACAGPVRPLRRDAARNRQRVLKAASEVFTERGLDVSLDEVARHAGVGVGTVYRRFRTKEDLVEALFVERIDAVAALAEEAAEAPDPWSGLASFLEEAAEMLAGDSGLRQLLRYATYGGDRIWYARQRNAPRVTRLVERVQAAGQLRSDLRPTDIPFILFILTEAAQFARGVSPEIWRRYLTLVLDGLRPEREGVTPLPVPALRPDEMEMIMRQSVPRHH